MPSNRSFHLTLHTSTSIFLGLLLLRPSHGLLYPTASTLGMISSLSVPVVEYFPERRILIDWCFAMAYDLPAQLSSFYNIPIWPGFQNPKGRDSRSLDIEELYNSTSNKIKVEQNKYDHKLDDNRHANDFSAGELYQGIEDLLVSYGFHETCLLQSVCELARHPFDDAHENILTDIFTFLLSPSQHRGFDASEQVYRETYEEAEMQGLLGHTNCTILFPDCHNDLLGLLTKVILPGDE